MGYRPDIVFYRYIHPFWAATLVMAAWIGAVLPAAGQKKDLIFYHLTKQDGLATNSVNDICQDFRGFIWLATTNSLQRYDGRTFTTYRHEPGVNEYRSSNNMTRLLADRNRRWLWVANSQGISRFDFGSEKLEPVGLDKPDEASNISSYNLIQDRLGNVWLTIHGTGLLRYDPACDCFQNFNKRFPELRTNVIALDEDRHQDGLLYLGGTNGMWVYDGARDELYTPQHNPGKLGVVDVPAFENNHIISVCHDREGFLWVNSWAVSPVGPRFFRYNLSSGRVDSFSLHTILHRRHFLDDEGTVWIIGDNLDYFDRQAGEFQRVVPDKNGTTGLDFSVVYQMLEDREHNKWLATDNGLYIFNENKQRVFTRKLRLKGQDQPHEASVNSFLETRDNRILATTWGWGLFEFDRDLRQVNHYEVGTVRKDGNFNLLWKLFEDHTGAVWVGGQAGRVMRQKAGGGEPEFYVPEAMQGSTVRAIAEDQYGNIWFGLQSRGIVRWDRATECFENVTDSTLWHNGSFGLVQKILVDRQKNLWVVNLNQGLIRLDDRTGKVLEHYRPEPGNPASIRGLHATDLIEVNDSILMVGTTMSLNVFNKRTRRFETATRLDGGLIENVGAMVLDPRGGVWISSYGLVHYNRDSKVLTNFDAKHGVLSETILTLYPLRDGRILGGTDRDLFFFRPEDLQNTDAPPDVILTGVAVRGDRLPLFRAQDGSLPILRLEYFENFLELEYASLSYLTQGETRYFYQLEGLDDDWVDAGSRRFTSYTDLKHGRYTFRVRCISAQGIPSANITSFHIVIAPPFWRTWWFYSLVGLAVAGLIYGANRFQINRLLEMERVRARIARDLHDDMGSTLSTINILSNMAGRQLPKDPVQSAALVEKIGEHSQRMMEAMDDIVWSINPVNDSMVKVVARMREFAGELLEAQGVQLTFRADEAVQDVKLGVEARRDFFLIFKEAVNNLAKYAKAGQAFVEVGLQGNRLRLTVQDDGTGFNVEHPETEGGGNGLANMRKRAQQLHGQLEIQSQKGRGTTIRLEIPV